MPAPSHLSTSTSIAKTRDRPVYRMRARRLYSKRAIALEKGNPMRPTLPLLTLPLIVLGAMLHAQPPAQPPGPPLLACGAHGDIEVLCGTRSPEDLEVTPDGKFLIVSQMVNGPGGGLMLFDVAKKTYAKIPITEEPRKDWGDSACPGPIGD